MDDQNKNLILATALSFLVILAWFVFFPPQDTTPPTGPDTATTGTASAPVAAGPTTTDQPAVASAAEARQVVLGTDTRIKIDTPELAGSISLTGGRIDDLSLKGYKVSLDADSDIVTLLSPLGTNGAYQALYSWAPGGDLSFEDVPVANTPWSLVSGQVLAPGNDIVLGWSNGKGLDFERVYAVDKDFMFTVTQKVTNSGDETQRLAPEGRLERYGEPDDLKGFFVIDEGGLRQDDDEREYHKYKKIRDYGRDNDWAFGPNVATVARVTEGGWIGFTDHYWMATLIPATADPFTSIMQYDTVADVYRAIARLDTVEVAPGQTEAVTTRLFAGAKRWDTIRAYESQGDVRNFLETISWGWYPFLTKPIFTVLHWVNGIIGNMGWSIIALTLIIKAALLPLAFKSYVSMAKMKELQPEMEKLKERAGDDKKMMQQEMMALYKKNKVNPASGCLPILLQIPIFFSLYKVIFVTIELRHAAWIGWIRDLSAPDPSSLMNLWGILPNAGPEPGSILALIFIGILPLLLGISMWMQQKLNPAPTDPTQQMIFAWMPWVFMFMLGSFASGLVLYWIANNTITFAQQYAIMRSQGFKPDVFGNIMSGFKRKKPDGK